MRSKYFSKNTKRKKENKCCIEDFFPLFIEVIKYLPLEDLMLCEALSSEVKSIVRNLEYDLWNGKDYEQDVFPPFFQYKWKRIILNGNAQTKAFFKKPECYVGSTPVEKVQLGLVCLNITLKEIDVYPSRTMTIKKIKEKGKSELKKRIMLNLKDLEKMIYWNEIHRIKVFRLSSNLFIHKSNPKVKNYSYAFAKKQLKKIGKLAKKFHQRLTFHPGQYNVVGSPNKDAFEKTIMDLNYQSKVLDIMGMDNNSVVVVHGGGLYGDKEKTIKRWIKNFKKLPKRVQNRLVIENDEKMFNIEDCLRVSKAIDIPVVLDTHHFDCYNQIHPKIIKKDITYYIPRVLKTWKKRKPKFHVSEQNRNKRIGAHSDYVEILPSYLLEIPEKYGIKIDIMIEAKKKELAVLKLMKKYNL